VPGAAHDGDRACLTAQRRAQHAAHRGLASLGAQVRRVALAQGPHRVEDRVEDVEAVVPQLDRVLPPAFRVVEAGRLRERPDRVHGCF
jgi:hypothetical protein